MQKGSNIGKNVLITGASSGIGATIALMLSKKGFEVWGTTRNLSKVQNLSKELQKNVHFIQMDVTDDESVRKGVEEFFKEAGKIDILINNAGYGVYGSAEEFPVEDAKRIFDANYFGALRVIQAVLPTMRKQREGLIINITSLAGVFVIPFQIHYSASKFALEALTEGLRQELRPFGIKVVAIQPGDIKTNFNDVTEFAVLDESPYKKWSDPCWKVIDENMQKAPGPTVIANKVWHVINKKNPRTRYPAGDFLSTKFPLVQRIVSDRVKEKMTRIFYGIDK
ncbi:MAG: SDR family oxidoreductase [Halanaerobiales bacterium]|nr:SDR family oxidoreductase [Halanaerobiales bacterium]